jgi:hypothetical protein
MIDQVERLKQLAAEAARLAALLGAEEYHVHYAGRQIRIYLETTYPGIPFRIVSADGSAGTGTAAIEVRWTDGPRVGALCGTLHSLISDLYGRGGFFEMIYMHAFTCRECGRVHGAALNDEPRSC